MILQPHFQHRWLREQKRNRQSQESALTMRVKMMNIGEEGPRFKGSSRYILCRCLSGITVSDGLSNF